MQQVKFFFLGPRMDGPAVVENRMNAFMKEVKVVNVLQSSASFGNDASTRIETVFTVVYEK